MSYNSLRRPQSTSAAALKSARSKLLVGSMSIVVRTSPINGRLSKSVYMNVYIDTESNAMLSPLSDEVASSV
ncbi:hypothetical protein GQX74_015721 [Glossina fuscipes]|nr:hypothetical protein GQX74_015721 [Glossina fuscipes]